MEFEYPIIRESELPVPRLELRYRKPKPGMFAGSLETICDYFLVIRLGPYDSRRRTRDGMLRHATKRIRIGRTSIGSGEDPGRLKTKPDGRQFIHTPYRDGRHIQWDAFDLKLPAFVVNSEGHAQQIQPEENKINDT